MAATTTTVTTVTTMAATTTTMMTVTTMAAMTTTMMTVTTTAMTTTTTTTAATVMTAIITVTTTTTIAAALVSTVVPGAGTTGASASGAPTASAAAASATGPSASIALATTVMTSPTTVTSSTPASMWDSLVVAVFPSSSKCARTVHCDNDNNLKIHKALVRRAVIERQLKQMSDERVTLKEQHRLLTFFDNRVELERVADMDTTQRRRTDQVVEGQTLSEEQYTQSLVHSYDKARRATQRPKGPQDLKGKLERKREVKTDVKA